jgi:tRNA-intron endonuclease
MQGRTSGDVVRVEGNARERYYDSRGYGTPDGAALDLAPVEAAHLLYRGDLESVDGRGFREFLASVPGIAVRFLVYKDLRDRGFYLAPGDRHGDPEADFVVFPRGSGPWDAAVEYRIRVVGEREAVPARDLGDVVLGVVDEESEITYLESERPDLSGTSEHALPTGIPATLLDDRVVVWDPPEELYGEAFYGQPLDRDDDTIQLSLLEGAHLVREGHIEVEGGERAVLERGRAVEGERFDRRLRVYRALRQAGVVPKTGFKFGADFRTYAHVSDVGDLGHSEFLVRVRAADHVFAPRDLALDVRLAHGVRKTMAFALVGEAVEWLALTRLTP